jgi:hypothetical protein
MVKLWIVVPAMGAFKIAFFQSTEEDFGLCSHKKLWGGNDSAHPASRRSGVFTMMANQAILRNLAESDK